MSRRKSTGRARSGRIDEAFAPQVPNRLTEMGPVQKAALNFIIARGSVKEQSFKKYINDLTSQTGNDSDLNDTNVHKTINENIRFMQLEVRRLDYEVDGDRYLALVNNQPDEASNKATNFTEIQLAYFKALVNDFVAHAGVIRKTDFHRCLSELPNTTLKKVTTSVRDATLNLALEDGWLFTDGSSYFLGVRAYAELRRFFDHHELSKCHVCKQSCVYGIHCNVNSCSTSMHRHCASQWFASKTEWRCPSCRGSWKGLDKAIGTSSN